MRGIYCLIIDVKKDTMIAVGALGRVKFEKAVYAYIGSAQNNLEKRIRRHLSSTKKIRWHIDYLLAHPHARIEHVFYKQAGKKAECAAAVLLEKSEKAIKGFGCSDCRCNSHLFMLRSLVNIKKLEWKIFDGV
jgi:Uri superfamily endonuclease